ncbi:unnamed protein product [Diatraea saccharalis]|uniref:Uncharacterized protein n=1 Tax=Diatraea saccharalis TaxID=40085 RepID=A0A9N9QTF1_9NEOP|nr:unnamed protein product [Diatraea saccharalis]
MRRTADNYHTSLKASAVSTSASTKEKQKKSVLFTLYVLRLLTTERLWIGCDWSFALLIAVASVQVGAEGPKKKIRIHLPQKVKHIHHHKKIYITNHPAAASQSQYAPAYLPSADGSVALPSNVALPAVAGLLPLNSMELYDDAPSRFPGGSSVASKLLPLYRARGYYGPTPSEVEDEEYDLAPPPEPEDSYLPAPTPSRVKIIKAKDGPRKKINKKPKTKRAPVRSRPRPEPEDEHPVSNFHEQFYSDVDGTGTIRKIRKPPRVEKIVDGDTEHIHTYSEEHIHKLVFDEESKLPGLVGVDPVGSMSALSLARPLIPFHGQSLVAVPPETLTGFASAASASSHLDYSPYNQRDVTHDHIFHDHGEIPADVDFSKEVLALPPKISYNSQGLRISGSHPKRLKSKYANKYPKPAKPTSPTDFSYYENIYAPQSGLKKLQRPKISQYAAQSETDIEDYRPIPSFKLLGKHKPRSYGGQAVSEFRQESAPSPFSVSSTIVHDYQPKAFPGASAPSGFSKFKDPFVGFGDSYANNYEYDTFASSSNVHSSDHLTLPRTKAKKSISTQNINFGGKDHQTTVDHLDESVMSSEINDDDTPTALESFSSFDDTRGPNGVTSTPYTIKESSPVHSYYTAMAVKAMQNEQASAPEASNDNFQYVEAPPQSTTPNIPPVATTTTAIPQYFEMSNSNPASTDLTEVEKRQRQRSKNTNKLNTEQDHRLYSVIVDYKNDDRSIIRPHNQMNYMQNSASDANVRGQLKYGDKI